MDIKQPCATGALALNPKTMNTTALNFLYSGLLMPGIIIIVNAMKHVVTIIPRYMFLIQWTGWHGKMYQMGGIELPQTNRLIHE